MELYPHSEGADSSNIDIRNPDIHMQNWALSQTKYKVNSIFIKGLNIRPEGANIL